MKTLIGLLLFAQMISTGNHRKIFTPSGGTAPVWDTTSGASCNPTTGSSMTFTCTVTTSAGLIVVGYAMTTNTAYTSVTVDGVAPTTIANQALTGSFGFQGLYYTQVTAGSHVILFTFPAIINAVALYVRPILGANATSPLDGTSNSVSVVGSGVSFSCGSFTTTSATDLVVAWGFSSSTVNVSAGSGYTLYAGATLSTGNSGGAYESLTSSSTGSFNPAFTNGNGGHQGCIAAAFKP